MKRLAIPQFDRQIEMKKVGYICRKCKMFFRHKYIRFGEHRGIYAYCRCYTFGKISKSAMLRNWTEMYAKI